MDKQSISNISKLVEMKEIYEKRAEEARNAVKFYEEAIAQEAVKAWEKENRKEEK